MIGYFSGPYFGTAKMKFVAENFGLKTAIVSGGILCVVAVLLTVGFLPKFLCCDGREGVKRREAEENARSKQMDINSIR